MLVSFLGSMGNVMKCSGIEEALCTIYATNTVDHTMSENSGVDKCLIKTAHSSIVLNKSIVMFYI